VDELASTHALLHNALLVVEPNGVFTNIFGEEIELAGGAEPSIDFLFLLGLRWHPAGHMGGSWEDVVDALEEPESYHGVIDNVRLFLAGVSNGREVEDASQEALRGGNRSFLSLVVFVHLDGRRKGVVLIRGGCLLFDADGVVGRYQLVGLIRN